MQTEIVRIKPNGVVQLPDWAVKLLIKQSGVRSKKRRVLKKKVRQEFIKALATDWPSLNQFGAKR